MQKQTSVSRNLLVIWGEVCARVLQDMVCLLSPQLVHYYFMSSSHIKYPSQYPFIISMVLLRIWRSPLLLFCFFFISSWLKKLRCRHYNLQVILKNVLSFMNSSKSWIKKRKHVSSPAHCQHKPNPFQRTPCFSWISDMKWYTHGNNWHSVSQITNGSMWEHFCCHKLEQTEAVWI